MMMPPLHVWLAADDPLARRALTVLLTAAGLPFRWTTVPEAPEGSLLLAWGDAPAATLSLPQVDRTDWQQARLTWVEGLPLWLPGPALRRLRDGSRILADLVGSTLALIGRQEELDLTLRDRWQTFAASYSRQSAQGAAALAVVNRYALRLRAWLEEAARQAGQPWQVTSPWPAGKRFAVALTHDLDVIASHRGSYARYRWQEVRTAPTLRRRFGASREMARDLLAGSRLPNVCRFEDWAAVEASVGATSTYYVAMPHVQHPLDPRYALDEPVPYRGQVLPLSRVLQALVADGHEVGLHGSYDSYADAACLQVERAHLGEALGGDIRGERQHYLRFHPSQTWRAAEQAGFTYDTTLGYNEAIGLRGAIATPFQTVDLAAAEPLALWELPMAVMDGPLFWEMKFNTATAVARSLEVLDEVATVGGAAAICWHPHVRDERAFPGWWQAYGDLIQELHHRGAWLAPAGTIVERWQQHQAQLIAPSSHGDPLP
jgi:peptidoglycan/xylan/chitin deacetylase (PgdA/CDA1 family)